MSEKENSSILVPLIVVALMAVVWVGEGFWPKAPKVPAAVAPAAVEEVDEVDSAAPGHTAAKDRAVSEAPEPGPTPPGRSGEPVGTEWSMYHGGPTLAGVVSTTLPEQPVEKWRFQADAPIYNTPVASEGQIFFCTSKGGVYALDFDGNEVWSKHIELGLKRDGSPDRERFEAPAACFDGT